MLCSAMAYGLAVNGAKVAIIGRNKEKLAKMSETLTENAKNEYGKDVTVKATAAMYWTKEELVKTYEQIKAELGSCGILINGAGGNQPGSHCICKDVKEGKTGGRLFFLGSKEENIRTVMDLNYMGTLLPIQVFTRDMVERERKHYQYRFCFFHPSSFQGHGLFQCKSAVQSLTQWLAIHFGQSGIRCNAIVPGFYAAEQNHDPLFNKDGSYTDRAGDIIAGTPMGRLEIRRS